MDLLITILISLIAIPLVAFTDGIARAIVGILFVLLMPGYSLISALFPARNSPGHIERLVLSVTVSIALSVLVGVALNFTSFGITLLPVVFIEFTCVLLFCLVAWIRRRKLPVENRFSIKEGLQNIELQLFPGGKKYGAILLSIVVLVVIGLLGAMYTRSILSAGEHSNEFYILSAEGTTTQYPRQVRIGAPVTVKAVLVNHEKQPANYVLRASISDNEVASSGEIYLKPDGKWENEITFNAINEGNNQRVEYRLFRDGRKQPDQIRYIYIDVFNR